MTPRPVAFVLAGLTTLALWQVRPHSQTPAFDLVIRNGHVVDGTGSPWFAADVGITGDTIALSPPLMINENQIDEIFSDKMPKVLASVA